MGTLRYKTLKFVVGSFGLDSVLLTAGSIPDPCYEMWDVTSLIITESLKG
jgi:hypothetical protein